MKALFGTSAGRGTGNSASGTTSPSKYHLPPFPHPLPETGLSLYCTKEGLYILPLRQSSSSGARFRSHHSPRTSISATTEDIAKDVKLARRSSLPRMEGAKIDWGREGKVKVASDVDVKGLVEGQNQDILCYGILGIQKLFNDSYLLVITSRTFAGDFCDSSRPVYKCTGVLIIPLSYERAKVVFDAEASRQSKVQSEIHRDDSEEESDTDDNVITPSVIAKDAFFGRDFATVKAKGSQAWLDQLKIRRASLDGNEVTEPQTNQRTEGPESSPDIATIAAITTSALTPEQRYHQATKAELEDKVVKETARQYSRGEMFWSYDFDLTTPLQRKQNSLDGKGKASVGKSSISFGSLAEPWPTLPLWRRADQRFWHNQHLCKDFVDAGLHGLVLPLMQGYFQVTSLPLDAEVSSPSEDGDPMEAVTEAASSTRTEAQLLIISRRSKERAGLRYQRRGVNELGQVANYVETEQILYLKRGDSEQHYLSFLQFRGSIPQYWKQDPFSMKPPPQLERNTSENRSACSKHFESQLILYGKVICVNLAEQHGKEGAITKAYKDAVEGLANYNVVYKPFDFHQECKGMKFENVRKLIDELKDDVISEMDFFWKRTGQSEAILSRQKSAFRVSCLDCLDRTNVVQSAFGRHVLNKQLEKLGIERDTIRDEEFDFNFNDSWANNGDMISQIYAGTRALKGDFTRTGKRNLMGMVNDATNSVYRMVQGAITDFFKQTVIDFQYGQISLSALERYNDNLAGQDPSETHRLARVRISAIEACSKEILDDKEERIAGWTLFSPIQPNCIVSNKLEEKVVLLTSKAIYICGYDFTTEMLMEYSKIRLGDLVGIQRGVYILSPNEGYHPENHWGLLLEYLNEETRLNSASMKNVPPKESIPTKTNFVAFRAVVDEAALESSQREIPAATTPKWKLFSSGKRLDADEDGQPQTSHALVDQIVDLIYTQCSEVGASDDSSTFIKEETIQSLAQAKANAPLFAPLIEGLKRRLWL